MDAVRQVDHGSSRSTIFITGFDLVRDVAHDGVAGSMAAADEGIGIRTVDGLAGLPARQISRTPLPGSCRRNDKNDKNGESTACSTEHLDPQ